jgi:hypothetical protein
MTVILQKRRSVRAGVLGAALLSALLAGCVDSAAPILTDAQPMFGPRIRLHVYSLVDGRATGPDIGTFRWDGTQYRVVGRPTLDLAAFTIFPFAGNDLIAQSRNSRPRVKGIEYAVVRKQADGVYLVGGIDEDDADAPTRAAHCAKGGSSGCRIETRDALLAFAKATAAKPDFKGALAIIVNER